VQNGSKSFAAQHGKRRSGEGKASASFLKKKKQKTFTHAAGTPTALASDGARFGGPAGLDAFLCLLY
jgi:hypothetical protein